MTEAQKIRIIEAMGYSLDSLRAGDAETAILDLHDITYKSQTFELIGDFIKNCPYDEFVNLKIEFNAKKRSY